MTPNENTDLGEDDVTKASAKQMDAAVPCLLYTSTISAAVWAI